MASAQPKPDPSQGIFETLLVVEGRPVELETHLQRLATSLEALFDLGGVTGARGSILDQARGIHLGRLRLTVSPDGKGGFDCEVIATEIDATLVFPTRKLAAFLRSVPVEGGLGQHKWADRALLDLAMQGAASGELPLLVDSDGTVLEASRGNVFAVHRDALVTPPADGRILPGIARRRAIEVAREEGIEVREEKVARKELLQAESVFLTGSVRGVEPVKSLDGVDLPHDEEIVEQIRTGLRRRWLVAPATARSPVAAP